MQTELLGTLSYCVIQLCYILVNLRGINIKDNQRDSCYSSWLIAQKTFLIKKNHLTCDHTTGEVLTTINNDFNYNYIYSYTWNLTFSRAQKVIQEKEVSQIWCCDQDLELPHDEIHCVMENRILSCRMMKII